jgi:hypothetical protein
MRNSKKKDGFYRVTIPYSGGRFVVYLSSGRITSITPFAGGDGALFDGLGWSALPRLDQSAYLRFMRRC